MSRCVVATAYGGPEVLSVIDVPPAEPGPGEVRLTVRAAGVNPADAKAYSGVWGTDPDALPMSLGYEAAGVVSAVGPAVADWSPGDEAIAFRARGTYAEELVVPTSALTPKPASLDWAEAGGLMLTGATAVHCLTATGVGRGDTVLVHGAAGGVGLMAVQLASLRGARVLGTASAANHEALRELGVVPVEYGAGLVDRVRDLAPDGVDVALDLVGTVEAMDTSLELVEDRHRIATIAGFARGASAGVQLLGGGPGADPGTRIRDEARPELARLAGAGDLRVLLQATFPLTEAAEAHRLVAHGHGRGKVVLLP